MTEEKPRKEKERVKDKDRGKETKTIKGEILDNIKPKSGIKSLKQVDIENVLSLVALTEIKLVP